MMKKTAAQMLTIIGIAGLLAGCNAADTAGDQVQSINESSTAMSIAGAGAVKPLALTLDMKGNYTGFAELPENCTMKEAEAAGYVVLHNNEMTAGRELWNQFVDQSAQGSVAGIRMAQFLDGEADSPFYTDLIFEDSKYYLFDNTAETLQKQPFTRLLNLTGQGRNALKESSITVLTDDSSLTFEEVWTSMISSNTEVIHSIAPHRIVTMTTN